MMNIRVSKEWVEKNKNFLVLNYLMGLKGRGKVSVEEIKIELEELYNLRLTVDELKKFLTALVKNGLMKWGLLKNSIYV